MSNVRLVPITAEQVRGLERSWLADAYEQGITELEARGMTAERSGASTSAECSRGHTKLRAAFEETP